jgi:hypothetical protein
LGIERTKATESARRGVSASSELNSCSKPTIPHFSLIGSKQRPTISSTGIDRP